MQNKDQQKKNIKNNFDNFSRKEKAITRYTRIYVKLNDRDNTKQANIQTDHVIEAWRLDLAVVDKKEKTCKIIDFAVPADSRIEEREKDQIEKYQDLGRELQKIWNVKVKTIPLVVGSLGAIPKQVGNRLKQIGVTAGTAQAQKTVLIGTALVIRKVLEI